MAPLPRLCLLVLTVATSAILTGCATVQPWQRGRLASPCMQFSPDGDLAAFASHWQESREGASGGQGLQGGGCGCK